MEKKLKTRKKSPQNKKNKHKSRKSVCKESLFTQAMRKAFKCTEGSCKEKNLLSVLLRSQEKRKQI